MVNSYVIVVAVSNKFIHSFGTLVCRIFQGACGGELACSTCHLIFDKDVYDMLPPKSDEEEDMLDLAFELTDT